MAQNIEGPAPAAAAHEAKSACHNASKSNETSLEKRAALRQALLAELRCAALRARLAGNDIEVAGVALKYGLVSVEQAMELLDARDALGWLDLKSVCPS